MKPWIDGRYQAFIVITGVVAAVAISAIPLIKMAQNKPDDEPDKCELAIENAEAVLELSSMSIDDYEYDVYDAPDTIMQQQFRVAEYQYFELKIINLQQDAMLRIMTYCR